MAPRGPAHNSKPDSVKANPEAVRLLTSLFTKDIIKKGDKARKWHEHPTYSSQFSSVAIENSRKRYTKLYAERFGDMNERSVEIKDGIKAELIDSERLQLSFSWSAALLDADGIMKAMLSFCHDLNDGQGPLMTQGLRDYTDPVHSEVGQDVVSTCIILLPFPVKPDFDEDVIKFNGSDYTIIYVIRFEAFEQRFATLKKRLVIRNINRDESGQVSATGQSATSAGTISESQNKNFGLTSAVTTV